MAERIQKFDEYFESDEHHAKIFSELGFSYIEDDGYEDYCDNCERNGCCPDHSGDSSMYVHGRLNPEFRKGPLGIPIYVDVIGVESAMEDFRNGSKRQRYLDLDTGDTPAVSLNILSILKSGDPTALAAIPEWEHDSVRAGEAILAHPDRYAVIPSIPVAHLLLVCQEFVSTVVLAIDRPLLMAALSRKWPYQRFNQAVYRQAELQNQWADFHGNWIREKVAGWINLVPVPPHISLQIRNRA